MRRARKIKEKKFLVSAYTADYIDGPQWQTSFSTGRVSTINCLHLEALESSR